ncbi:MAG: hypothetical protein AB7G44_09925 [Bacteroidia bacterium]
MSKIIYRDKEEYKRTVEFKQKRDSIIEETKNKYKSLMKSEAKLLKRLVLWFKMWLEVKQRMDKLTSNRNLNFNYAHHPQSNS